jgi:biopolymer transport protein ExbD
MAFASNSGGGPMADINVTPLVDVMLVLLIIFMVTAPTLSYPIDIDLRIDAAGQVYWNEAAQPISALQGLMEVEVNRDPANQPALEIDTSPDADYGVLAKVLASAKNAGMIKIGFVQNQ